jgi:hypothetical protein
MFHPLFQSESTENDLLEIGDASQSLTDFKIPTSMH